MRPTSNAESQPSSVAADQQFYVSYGLIISARLADIGKIREEIERLGGRLVFQTVSNGPLYVLREYQLKRAILGDISQLREIHERKTGEGRDEKK